MIDQRVRESLELSLECRVPLLEGTGLDREENVYICLSQGFNCCEETP